MTETLREILIREGFNLRSQALPLEKITEILINIENRGKEKIQEIRIYPLNKFNSNFPGLSDKLYFLFLKTEEIAPRPESIDYSHLLGKSKPEDSSYETDKSKDETNIILK